MDILKKTNKFLFRNISIFHYDLEKHLDFLNDLPIPKNKMHRSYYQYKCQCFQKPGLVNFRNNLIAFFLVIPVILFLLFKPGRGKTKTKEKQLHQAVFIFAGVENIVPLQVKQKYPDFTEVDFGKSWFLKTVDLKYIFKLKGYILSPYFLLKSIYKMAMYRAVIDEHKPGAIICSSEYSFTSSLLTWYCEQNHVRHINVMHGEKLLNIRDSFFQFHECYVWDKHYVDLFNILRAGENQFIIDTPPSLFIKNTNSEPEYELTYYLAGETLSELERIQDVLHKIKIPDNKICIRPHPRYSDLNKIAKVFKPFAIENIREVKIEQSINNTKKIASLYSTVLYQGFISGKQIVVDNLTQVSKFEKLKDLKFIVLSKPHLKISDLITTK